MTVNIIEEKNKKCEDCIEWEVYGYGCGCVCKQTMTPIDANNCEYYADRHIHGNHKGESEG